MLLEENSVGLNTPNLHASFENSKPHLPPVLGRDEHYALDQNILHATSLEDLPKAASPDCKGTIIQSVMPDDIKDDILQADLSTLFESVSNRQLFPDVKTGQIDFPDSFRRTLRTSTCDYIEYMTKRMNSLRKDMHPHSNNSTIFFTLQDHLSAQKVGKVPGFHIEEESGDKPMQTVSVISVTGEEGDQDRETELLMTDGLSHCEAIRALKDRSAWLDLDPKYKSRVISISSQDLLVAKGLGDGRVDILEHALIHRAPVHKAAYVALNIPRKTMGWAIGSHQFDDFDAA